jgi:cytidyltransferase-like protein
MSKKVCISGGFDPVHEGHLDMIEDASQYGDVIVILNSDDWLIRKKGFCFFNWQSRARLLASMRGVAGIIAVDDSDGTVCEALERLKPDYFANGGDRKLFNTPEIGVCERLDIEMLWNIGGSDKANSSSEIAKRAIVHRKWGTYLTLDEGAKYKVKRLVIEPNKSISLQKHMHRTETWTIISGVARVRNGAKANTFFSKESVYIEKEHVHQVTNVGAEPLVIIETQVGDYLGEDDIIRLS